MNGNQPLELWYLDLARKYGSDFAREAGYFEETNPWTDSYTKVFGMDFLKSPFQAKHIIQFSGAFWPFHEGHLAVCQAAINHLDADLMLMIHVDHSEYRHKKGDYDEAAFKLALEKLRQLKSEHRLEHRVLYEDLMPNGCSRNFTRLYQELATSNPDSKVWFLAGGDRASFCRSFVDDGQCIVALRDSHPDFLKYSHFANDRIVFLHGRNDISSSEIRRQRG